MLGKVFTLEPFLNPDDDDFEATVIEQPGQIIGAAGAGTSVNCTFKNTGNTEWPKNVKLKLLNGSNHAIKSLGLDNMCVQPNEELKVSINVKLPEFAGKKILTLMLVHGDDQVEFGDEVTVTLQVELENHETQCPDFEQLLEAIEQPLNETNGNTFYVDQDEEAETDEVNQLDLSVDSWQMVDDTGDEPAPQPQPKDIEYEMQDEDDAKMKSAVDSATPGDRSKNINC